MPLPTQLFSRSMRSGVHVALPEGMFLAGAIVAGSSSVGAVEATDAAVSDAGGSDGDGRGFDGAMDGDMDGDMGKRPRSGTAAGLGRRRGVCPRATGNGENAKPRSEISVRGRKSPSGNAPDVTPMPGGGRPPKKVSPTKQLRRIHRAASRLKDGKPAVGVAPVRVLLNSGPLLVAC